MYVVIGIPTYNEADTVAHVVQEVDAGLSILARDVPQLRAVIVNADSNSQDGTPEAFSNTPTRWPKSTIGTGEMPGKGKNVYALIDRSRVLKADCLVTLDGDVRSVTADWVVHFAKPILAKKVDFVTPVYERSPFEGSTTNQFAWPLANCYFGSDIRQPIAGDFALSKPLMDILSRQDWPPSAYFYGVDIFLTLTALTQGLRVAMVSLGRKLHKPSHEKLTTMFPQVANAAAYFIARARRADYSIGNDLGGITFIRDIGFEHRTYANYLLSSMADRALSSLGSISWLAGLEEEVSSCLKRLDLSSGAWSKILCRWIWAVHSGSDTARDWGGELLPFFTVRAVTFWRMADAHGEDAAAADLEQLVVLLRSRLSA